MVTGASTADLAIVLVDARKGVIEQSAPPRLPRLAAARPAPGGLRQQDGPRRLRRGGLRRDRATSSPRSAPRLEVTDLDVHPDLGAARRQRRRALDERCPGTRARRCSTTSSTSHIASDRNLIDARFPVQWVIRPMTDEHHDYRGYAGQVAGGVLQPGDEVVVLPSGRAHAHRRRSTRSTARSTEAFPPLSVTLRLEDELDISRGDMICRPHNRPTRRPRARGDGVLDERRRRCEPGGRYALKHTTRTRARDGRGAALPHRRQHPAPRRGRPTGSS